MAERTREKKRRLRISSYDDKIITTKNDLQHNGRILCQIKLKTLMYTVWCWLHKKPWCNNLTFNPKIAVYKRPRCDQYKLAPYLHPDRITYQKIRSTILLCPWSHTTEIWLNRRTQISVQAALLAWWYSHKNVTASPCHYNLKLTGW